MKTSRKTVAKSAILDLINQADRALSHQEIQHELNGICDRVTIYRVLDRLTEEGLVHKIVNTDGVMKFAACHACSADHDHVHRHVHFNCEKCHKVTCLDQVEPIFSLPNGYEVKDVNFTITGICPECQLETPKV